MCKLFVLVLSSRVCSHGYFWPCRKSGQAVAASPGKSHVSFHPSSQSTDALGTTATVAAVSAVRLQVRFVAAWCCVCLLLRACVFVNVLQRQPESMKPLLNAAPSLSVESGSVVVARVVFLDPQGMPFLQHSAVQFVSK